MILMIRRSTSCLLRPRRRPCRRWYPLLGQGGISRRTWKRRKIWGWISMRSEVSSDGIVTSPLSCLPMPSLLVFAYMTRVTFLQTPPHNKLNTGNPFFPSPPLKCIPSWPDSSFPGPLVPGWYKNAAWWRRQHQYWASHYHTRARLKAG